MKYIKRYIEKKQGESLKKQVILYSNLINNTYRLTPEQINTTFQAIDKIADMKYHNSVPILEKLLYCYHSIIQNYLFKKLNEKNWEPRNYDEAIRFYIATENFPKLYFIAKTDETRFLGTRLSDFINDPDIDKKKSVIILMLGEFKCKESIKLIIQIVGGYKSYSYCSPILEEKIIESFVMFEEKFVPLIKNEMKEGDTGGKFTSEGIASFIISCVIESVNKIGGKNYCRDFLYDMLPIVESFRGQLAIAFSQYSTDEHDVSFLLDLYENSEWYSKPGIAEALYNLKYAKLYELLVSRIEELLNTFRDWLLYDELRLLKKLQDRRTEMELYRIFMKRPNFYVAKAIIEIGGQKSKLFQPIIDQITNKEEETLPFIVQAIKNMEEGRKVSIEYHPGYKEDKGGYYQTTDSYYWIADYQYVPAKIILTIRPD